MLASLRVWAARLRGLFGRKRRDRELEEELRSHLEMLTEEGLRRGMSPKEARQAARRSFGGVTQVREAYRERRGLPLLENLWQDLRYAFRNLVRSPGFAAAAIFSLALGIGANSAIFSFVDAIILRPLNLPRPGELVRVHTTTSQYRFNRLSYREYITYRDQNRSLSGLVAQQDRDFAMKLREDELARVLYGCVVSGNFFSVLGVEPAMGRTFRPEEDSAAAKSVVAVLSHRCWRVKFHSDPQILGAEVKLNGQPATIIGVAPASFPGTDLFNRPEIYVPLAMTPRLFPSSELLEDPKDRSLSLFGRLKPGVPAQGAQADFAAIAKALENSYPDTNRQRSATVLPEVASRLQQNRDDALLAVILMAIVAAVLLIACVNVANLLLGRASARVKELAIRLSVGASRGRLIRQLLTESLLLAALGAGAGLLLAQWVIGFLASIKLPTDYPVELAARMDSRVLLYSVILMVVTAMLFGLAPAIRATKVDLVSPVKGVDRSRAGRYRGRSALVAVQTALSLVLLVAAGLFVKSFLRASGANPGYRTENVLLLSFNPPLVGYSQARTQAFYRQLQERVQALPGVRSVTLASHVQLGASNDFRRVLREGTELPEGNDAATVMYNRVEAGFFETMDTPILRGRAFESYDTENSPRVAIVNETMARRFWPHREAIGQRIRLGNKTGPVLEVIGVARDGKYGEAVEQSQAYFYLPYRQDFQSRMTLMVHTAVDPTTLAPAVRQEVQALSPELPVFDVRTMKEVFENKGLLAPRLIAQIVGAMGFIGLALAVVGLYAVMTFAVSRRTKEIGIRMALGASRASILRMVLGAGLRVTMVGMVIGLGAAFGVTRFFAEFLERVSPTDPVTFGGVTLVLLCVAVAACWLPARRASRVDPIVTLRYE